MIENKDLATTISMISDDEEQIVKELIADCGLENDDINLEKLRHFIAARKKGDIVGVVGLEIVGSNALLRSLAVSKPHRNQGIAKNLCRAIENYARSRSISDLYLLTMTAEGFFARNDYLNTERGSAPVDVQATHEFKHMCPESAVCMTKKLG